jgi:hypothetical protein
MIRLLDIVNNICFLFYRIAKYCNKLLRITIKKLFPICPNPTDFISLYPKDLNLKTIVNSRLSNVSNGQLGQYFYDYKTNGFKYLPTGSGDSNHSSQSSGSNNSINNINNRSNDLHFNQMPSLDKLMMKGNRSKNIKLQPFRF